MTLEGPPQQGNPIDPAGNFPSRVLASKLALHIADWSAIDLPPHAHTIFKATGIYSSLVTPIRLAGECIGVLSGTRAAVQPGPSTRSRQEPTRLAKAGPNQAPNMRLLCELSFHELQNICIRKPTAGFSAK